MFDYVYHDEDNNSIVMKIKEGVILTYSCEDLEIEYDMRSHAYAKFLWLLDNDIKSLAEMIFNDELGEYLDFIQKEYSSIKQNLINDLQKDKGSQADIIALEIMYN